MRNANAFVANSEIIMTRYVQSIICTPRLKTVDEVWPVVSSNPDLIRRLSLQHVVPLARETLGVLSSQRHIHEDGTSKKTDDKVGENHGVSSKVSRGVR